MQKIIKKVLLWCMALLLISTMHPISASAATKKVDLKTPVIYNLEKNRRWTLISTTCRWSRIYSYLEHQDTRLKLLY